MDDFIFFDEEKVQISQVLNGKGNMVVVIQLIKLKYLFGLLVIFVVFFEDRKVGYEVDIIDVENGCLVYELSCLYCYENE